MGTMEKVKNPPFSDVRGYHRSELIRLDLILIGGIDKCSSPNSFEDFVLLPQQFGIESKRKLA